MAKKGPKRAMTRVMSNYALLPFVLLAVHFVGINCVVKDDLPHIVTILVDDWGWSNFGSHREGVSQGQ